MTHFALDIQQKITKDKWLKHEQLVNSLEPLPVVNIIGVIEPNGITYDYMLTRRYYTLIINIFAWKYEGGEMKKEKLTLYKDMPREQVKEIQKSFEGYHIVNLQAKILENKSTGLLVEISQPEEIVDTELNAYIKELQKPVGKTISGNILTGEFSLNRERKAYETVVSWIGHDVRLDFIFPDEINIGSDEEKIVMPKYFLIFEKLYDSQKYWNEQAIYAAVEELSKEKYNEWRSDLKIPITVELFKEKCTLEVIMIKDSVFHLWFDDGGLFSGNRIHVAGGIVLGIKDVNLIIF